MIKMYADGEIIEFIPETKEEYLKLGFEEKTNCKNCGAPLEAHVGKCEYCGTIWWMMMIRNWWK